MSPQFNRHKFAYPFGVNHSEPRLGYRDIDAEGGVEALLHPAVKSGAHLPPHVQPGYEQSGGQVLSPVRPHVAFGYDERATDIGPGQLQRDYEAASRMADAERGEMAYDHGGEVGVVGATPIVDRAQGYLDARAAEQVARQGQVDAAYQYGQQYLNNPLDAKGRSRMERQFWEAPLGGHVRGALEGQELFGHQITRGQARMAEQGLAGLTAVGVGVPAFLAAVNQLTTPQSAETIPL